MATPPVVDTVTNLQNESSAVAKINANAQRAADAISRSLSTTDATQNAMNVPLDMNSQRIINLPTPTQPTDPVRLQDIVVYTGPVILIPNTTTPATPSSGGIIFVENGALKYKGSNGSITVLAPA